MEHYTHTASTAERLAVGLGLFSVGLGLAELAAPRSVARLIGLEPDNRTRATLRTMGARELGNGLAVLAQPDRAWPIWSRVGGDAIDLSLLGRAMGSENAERGRAAAAAATVLGVTALDLLCAIQLHREAQTRPRAGRSVLVEESITVNKPVAEVYEFWKNFENFPRFMRHIESVKVLSDSRSRWKAKAPAGMSVEWEAELVGERANEWLAWRSVEGSDIQHSGSVRFEHAPGARGTEVHVRLEYTPPAGMLGRNIARLFGEEPEWQVHDDLRRFKQILETGEIAVSEGPGLWRPARPAARPEELGSHAGVNR